MVDHRGRGAGVRAGVRRAPVAGAVHQPAEQRHGPGHRLDQPRLRGSAADVGNHAAVCGCGRRPLRLRPRDRARRRPGHARHGAHAACPQHLDADPADRRRRRRRRRDGGPGRAHVGGRPRRAAATARPRQRHRQCGRLVRAVRRGAGRAAPHRRPRLGGRALRRRRDGAVRRARAGGDCIPRRAEDHHHFPRLRGGDRLYLPRHGAADGRAGRQAPRHALPRHPLRHRHAVAPDRRLPRRLARRKAVRGDRRLRVDVVRGRDAGLCRRADPPADQRSTQVQIGRGCGVSGAGTQRLLEAPVLPAIARLAAPGLALAVFQTAVSIADTHFVGRLGTDALAGLALVFPLVMLLQMTSAGAMGGGVSSAVARALGGGHLAAARRLVAHAAVIALGAGLAFTLLLVGFGRSLYVVLGAADSVLAQALAYSDVLFAGAVLVWLANTFASALRGSGNTALPAGALAAAALVQIPLSGALTLGWWPFPALGIRGTALAYALAFGVAALGMGLYLWSSPLRPGGSDWRLERRLFGEILRVGALSSVSALQTVLTAIILTGCVGSFGTAALAGYGVGVRLELLQVPIVFAIGQALVILVGTHIGAGRPARAKRIAWTGTLLAVGVSLAIGVSAALFPAAWVRIFSDDPDVLEIGGLYLRSVAPFYALFAAGMAL